VKVSGTKGKKNIFELYSSDGEIKSCKLENGQLVKGHHDHYLISANSEQEMKSWTEAIKTNIACNPLFEIIKKRISNSNSNNNNNIIRNSVMEKEDKVIDFQELHDACLMCSMNYKTPKSIKEAYGLQTQVLEDTARNLRSFMLVQAKLQIIVLCGTVPSSSVTDKPIDVFNTFGFDKAADLIDANLVKQLKKGVNIHIFGHSLGASLAVLLALHLQAEGFKVEKVITFGQPKIAKEKEKQQFKHISLTRVVDFSDSIPLLFPGYIHIGHEVVLFHEQFYSQSLAATEDPKVKRQQEQNHIENYLRNIKSKVADKKPVRVTYEEGVQKSKN